MKFFQIMVFAGAASVFCSVHPASAATKCVALNSSSTTCTYVNPGTYVVDWTATCTTSSTSIGIKGIGVCASTAATTVGTTADSLTVANDGSSDKYCWCKMTSPAVSGWVVGARTSAGNCANLCAHDCSYYAAYNSAFRSALFSSLGD